MYTPKSTQTERNNRASSRKPQRPEHATPEKTRASSAPSTGRHGPRPRPDRIARKPAQRRPRAREHVGTVEASCSGFSFLSAQVYRGTTHAPACSCPVVMIRSRGDDPPVARGREPVVMIRAPRGLESGYAGDLVAYRATASTNTPEQGAEGVPSLHELCSRVVTDCYLSPKTVCEVMDFAKSYNVPMLQRRVELFVCHAWAGVRAVHDPETLQQGDATPSRHHSRGERECG